MKGRGGRSAPAPDLLVCFPARSHFALMPKPICSSPSRPLELAGGKPAAKKLPGRSSPLFKNINAAGRRAGAGAGGGSRRYASSEMEEEPTSPKVTCAGQIKVRPTTKKKSSGAGERCSSNKDSWISVVEKIEMIRSKKKKNQQPHQHWLDFFNAFKSGIRFPAMTCFGSPSSFHGGGSSDDEEIDEEEDDDDDVKEDQKKNTVFSKWFMVLEEDNNEDSSSSSSSAAVSKKKVAAPQEDFAAPPPPPPNALLLMRCRSAPSNGSRRGAGDVSAGGDKDGEEEEGEKGKQQLIMMSNAPNFFKVSTDIAKETWLVGGMEPFMARSRSWRR